MIEIAAPGLSLRDVELHPLMPLNIESTWLIGSRGNSPRKPAREDSDFDLLLCLSNNNDPLIMAAMSKLPDAIESKQTGIPHLLAPDLWGPSFWESIGGQKSVDVLVEQGRDSLLQRGFANAQFLGVDIFLTTESSKGHCVRLAWQSINGDDGDSVDWEGLGYIYLGENWKPSANRIL